MTDNTNHELFLNHIETSYSDTKGNEKKRKKHKKDKKSKKRSKTSKHKGK